MGKYKKNKNLSEMEPTVSFKEGVKSMMKNIQYWSNAPLWTKKINKATKVWFNTLNEKKKSYPLEKNSNTRSSLHLN